MTVSLVTLLLVASCAASSNGSFGSNVEPSENQTANATIGPSENQTAEAELTLAKFLAPLSVLQDPYYNASLLTTMNVSSERNGTTIITPYIVHPSLNELRPEFTNLKFTVCGAGQYVVNDACSLCPIGKYNEGTTTRSKCEDCPWGTYDSYGTNGDRATQNEGKWGGSSSSRYCLGCFGILYGTKAGMTTLCQTCNVNIGKEPTPTGLISADPFQVGHTGCAECSLGKYYETTLFKCIECRANTQSGSVRTQCDECAQGEYRDRAAGMTTCEKCPVGKVGAQGTGSGCYPCPIGTYMPNLGESHCIPCPRSRYGDTSGLGSCKSCPAGRFNSDSNSQTLSTCHFCPVGTFRPLSSTLEASFDDSCKPCPVGKATGSTGDGTSCSIQCTKGQTNTPDTSAQTYGEICYPCNEGYFSDPMSTKNQVCASCGSGEQPTSDNGACEKCDYGKYGITIHTGAHMCNQCLFSNGKDEYTSGVDRLITLQKGSQSEASCVNCPGGHRCQSGKDEGPCPRNYYQAQSDNQGNLQCAPCPNGKFTDKKGQLGVEACKSCDFGGGYGLTPSEDDKDNMVCRQCEPGTFNNVDRNQRRGADEECKPCWSGTYSATKGVQICALCPVDYFGTGTGQFTKEAACKRCEPGTFTDGDKRGTCSEGCPNWMLLQFAKVFSPYRQRIMDECKGGSNDVWSLVGSIALIFGSPLLFVLLIYILIRCWPSIGSSCASLGETMAACCKSMGNVMTAACKKITSLCDKEVVTNKATPVPGYYPPEYDEVVPSKNDTPKQKDLPDDPDDYKDDHDGPSKKKRKRRVAAGARFIDFPYRIYARLFPSQATKGKGYSRVQTYDLL